MNVNDIHITAATQGTPWWVRVDGNLQSLACMDADEAEMIGRALVRAAKTTRENERRFLERCRQEREDRR